MTALKYIFIHGVSEQRSETNEDDRAKRNQKNIYEWLVVWLYTRKKLLSKNIVYLVLSYSS